MLDRGKLFELGPRRALITVHPSYLLRLPDAAAQAREYQKFLRDLALTKEFFGDQQAA